MILTELAPSKSWAFFRDRLQADGFVVCAPPIPSGDYGVIVAVAGGKPNQSLHGFKSLGHRIASLDVKFGGNTVRVIGMYVPSRGPASRRNEKKRLFQAEVERNLEVLAKAEGTDGVVIGGDLNVVERNHIPKYAVFGDWEYRFYEAFQGAGLVDCFRSRSPEVQHSWIGRSGDGYRFDHFFSTSAWKMKILGCEYLHDLRRPGLSDHSGLLLVLAGPKS